MLAKTNNTQKIKLKPQPGNFVVQYCRINCNATKSEAMDTASLNQ